MLSTIGYSRMKKLASKQRKVSDLTHDILKIINRFSKADRVKSSDLAKMLYDNSIDLMSKHKTDLKVYCQSVVKALRLANFSFNKHEVIKHLLNQFNDSTKVLNDTMKHGRWMSK